MVSIPVTELPAGTGAIKVTVQRLNGTGMVWVDDVRCEEGVSRKEDKTYYYHCDYLGSPRVMTDPLGNVIWRQDYYAFGSDYASTSLGNTHKFTGHVQDAATGQYYAKARYFTTNLGRFSQPDPILSGIPEIKRLINPQLLNPYVYCTNNPLKYSDPNGCEIKVEGTEEEKERINKDIEETRKDKEVDESFKLFEGENSPTLIIQSGKTVGAGDTKVVIGKDVNTKDIVMAGATVTINYNLIDKVNNSNVVSGKLVLGHEVGGHAAKAANNPKTYRKNDIESKGNLTKDKNEKTARKFEDNLRKRWGITINAKDAREMINYY